MDDRRRREAENLRHAAMTWDRSSLVALCASNDANGCWMDDDREAEGFDPATREELVAIVLDWADQITEKCSG